MKKLPAYLAFAFIFSLASCGGGGGDISFGPGSGSNAGDSGGVSGGTVSGGSTLRVSAAVAQTSCTERISNVDQTFKVDGNLIDTGIVTLNGTRSGSTLSAGFSESNGDCVRTYQIEIADANSSNSDVTLSAHSNCAGSECETQWLGSAQAQ